MEKLIEHQNRLVFLAVCAFLQEDGYSHFSIANLSECGIGKETLVKILQRLENENKIENHTVNGFFKRYKINNFEKCNNIWNMDKNIDHKNKIYNDLVSGNRKTFVYVKDNEYIAEASLVFNKADEDYTIPNVRIYLSRVIVKKDFRGKGYGKKLMNYIIDYAKNNNYKEMSLRVDLDNYIAFKLYVDLGFTKIQYIGEDENGKYVKLIKNL